MKAYGGRIARAAGLVITTSISATALSSSTFGDSTKATLIFVVIFIGAFLAAIAADFDKEE